MTTGSSNDGHPDDLRNTASAPTYRGRPVPWVTRWSAEHLPLEQIVLPANGTGPLRYATPTLLDRDRRGVLWLREGNAPGAGEPHWAEVSGPRQRRAMRNRRCQVCGQRMPHDMPIPFLFSRPELAALRLAEAEGRPATTTTPPCCHACWPLAGRLCPHLIRNGAVPCQVTSITGWGAFGDLYTPDGQRHGGRYLRYGHPHLPRLLGKQVVVHLHDIQPVE